MGAGLIAVKQLNDIRANTSISCLIRSFLFFRDVKAVAQMVTPALTVCRKKKSFDSMSKEEPEDTQYALAGYTYFAKAPDMFTLQGQL